MRFISEDNEFEVSLNEQVRNQMIEYVRKAKYFETGGILLGKYDHLGVCAEILNISGPPKDSESGSNWFIRGIKGLQSIINSSWQRKEYYVGEWHFHPKGHPNPSGVDIQQMVEIALSKKYSCPEPILIILGGSVNSFEISCFVVLNNYRTINLMSNDQLTLVKLEE